MKEVGRLRAAFMREKSEGPVACPKPQRVGFANDKVHDVPSPVSWKSSHHSQDEEMDAGFEILDIMWSKSGDDRSSVGCSPPYFCGSPPIRADNPLIHDEHFVHRVPIQTPAVSKPNSCSRSSYGTMPSIRIEGFDCLDRDRRRSIPAMA